MRSYDPEVFRKAVAPFPEFVSAGFDAETWTNNRDNILLEDNGSVALFHLEYDGVYSGHYFFKVGGRAAIDLGKRMLEYMFSNGTQAIFGRTEVANKPACWMSRQLGFKSLDVVDTIDGPQEIFCLTSQDYKDSK